MLAILMLTFGVFASLPAVSADTPVLVITQPAHQGTIHDNTGTVAVAVSLQGADLAAGRHLRVLLDGKLYGEQLRTLSFTMRNVDRGEHSLSVTLVDDTNAVVTASPTITFYLQRASVLLPIR
jgi:hypothetical protein